MEVDQVDDPRMNVVALRACLRSTFPKQLSQNLDSHYCKTPYVPGTMAIKENRRISSSCGTGTTRRTCHYSE